MYVLLAGMVGLYILHFTGSGNGEIQEDVVLDTLSTQPKGEKVGRIYYVNTDTIWDNYKYVIEALEKMEAKKRQYENQIQSRLQTFEREVTEFRANASMMSEVEAQIKQRDLMRKEQELAKMSEELEIRFINEEKEWNDKLRGKIIGHIEDATSDRSYDYILGYSMQSNIIVANDSLDLTQEILNGLNADYEKSKTQEE